MARPRASPFQPFAFRKTYGCTFPVGMGASGSSGAPGVGAPQRRRYICLRAMTGAPLYDVAVIGGGIVGLAAARQLLARGAGRVAVLDREPAVARHQTGHNSGVIHAGL
jgi:NADPH-dependent 2,4-dienoyl-CoA reductase/sulfur reductase-like enzyme